MSRNFDETYESYRLMYENGVKLYLEEYFAKISSPLSEAMQYSLNAGGKRLRPVLVLACASLNGKAEEALPFAIAMELIHTYSLIHDDLPCMDNDDFRRGKPTNHKVYGEGMAVLSGDGLLNLSYEVMSKYILKNCNSTFVQGYIKASSLIAECAGALGMVGGQCADLVNENNPEAGQAELEYIHSRKTGALISAACLAGSYCAGLNDSDCENIAKYAGILGVLFQVTDDMLDVTGNIKTLGKTAGKDLKSQKLTYIKLYGYDKTKQISEKLLGRAIEALEPMGEKTWFLKELAIKTSVRNN